MNILKMKKSLSLLLSLLLCSLITFSAVVPVFATEIDDPLAVDEGYEDPMLSNDSNDPMLIDGGVDDPLAVDEGYEDPVLSSDNNDPTLIDGGVDDSLSGSTTTEDDWTEITVEDEMPNTDIVVIPSDANALVLMDTGAQSPKGVPGDVVTIVLPVAVNKEYLPSERYMLRNINVAPAIPTDTSVSNWPFDLINASYTRHLDDMSYNSTAEIYYDFRISEFATKGVYPVNFEVNATVWRYDDVNGTTITEDVTFELCVYVTIVGDGKESGVQTSFGALQLAATNESGVYDSPTASPGQGVTLQLPIINKGGTLTKVTISPVISSSLEEFPFIADNANYGLSYEEWGSGETNYVEFYFTVSSFATTGNKPVRFKATYFENGVASSCEFVTYIYIKNGYVEPEDQVTTAMSVMVKSYKLLVDDAEVSGLMAGDDATVKLTLINNAMYDTSYKNVASLSLTNSTALMLTVGSSNAAYVSSIKPGETAEVEFKISVKRDAEVGPTTIGVSLAYENGDNVAGNASQSIMIPISQPMDVVLDTPIVYGTPNTEEPTSINLNMVNMGRAKALNVTILAMEGITMAENYYGGDLLAGGSLNADFQVNCTKVGEFTGKLIVQFEDANGELYTQEVDVPMVVSEPEPEPEPVVPAVVEQPEEEDKSGIPWWLWLILFFLLLMIAVIIIAMIVNRKHGRWEKVYSSKAGGAKK